MTCNGYKIYTFYNEQKYSTQKMYLYSKNIFQ